MLGVDRLGVGNASVVEQVVAVPAGVLTADLHQLRPHLSRRRLNGDG